MTQEQLLKDIAALEAQGADQSIIDSVRTEGEKLIGNTAGTAGKTNPAQQTSAPAQGNVHALTSQSSGASSSTSEVVGDGISDSEPSDLQIELEGLNTKVTEAETALQTCLGANKAPGACSSEKLKVGIARKAVQTFQTKNPDVQPYVAPVEPDVEGGSTGVEIDTTIPSLDWKGADGKIDYERFNAYNVIANERARKAKWEAENPGKTYPYGYDLRQMEARYTSKYGALPAEMAPFETADDLIVSLGGTATGKGAAIAAQGEEEEEEEEEVEVVQELKPFDDPRIQKEAHNLEKALGLSRLCNANKAKHRCQAADGNFYMLQRKFLEKYGQEALDRVLESTYDGGLTSDQRFGTPSTETTVAAFGVELADYTANFNTETLANDPAYKQMDTDASALATQEIQDFMIEYAEKYGYDTPEWHEAVEKKWIELYTEHMKELGYEKLASELYAEGYNKIRESYGEASIPDWVQDSNFLLGTYRFLEGTLPKGVIGMFRLLNGDNIRRASQQLESYESGLESGLFSPGQMVSVVTGTKRTGDGTVETFETMTIEEAIAYKKREVNSAIDVELDAQGATQDINSALSIIPQAYNLDDGIGFDDLPGLLGESLGYMAIMMVPGGAVFNAFLMTGSLYSDNLDAIMTKMCNDDATCTYPTSDMYIKAITEGKDGMPWALLGGPIMSALESIGFKSIGNAIFKPHVVRNLLKTTVIRYLRELGDIPITSAILTEAVTEGLQTLTEHLTQGLAIDVKTPFSRVNPGEIWTSMKAGGLTGGAITGGGSVATGSNPVAPATPLPAPKVPSLTKKNQSLHGGGSFDYEGTELKVGSNVTVQGLPLKNGEYRISETEYIMVENGKVTSMFIIDDSGTPIKKKTTTKKTAGSNIDPATKVATATGDGTTTISTQAVVGGDPIHYEGTELKEGVKVTKNDGTALSDGEYQIDATTYIKVEGGVITSKFTIDGEVVVNTIDKVGTRVGSDLAEAAAAAGVDNPVISTGTIVGGDDFHFEGENIIEGTKVTDTNGTALADGEYQIGDNEFIVVENGQVKHIFEEDPDGQPIYKKEAGKKGSELGGEAKVGSGTNQLNTTTTVDGNTTFEYDGDLAEGTSVNTVTDGVVSPLADGEYEIEAGKFIKVENGKVTSIFNEGDGGASLQGGKGAGNQSGLTPKQKFENATGEGDISVNKLTLFNNDIIYYEGDVLEVGTVVVDANGNQLAAGDYEISENSFITVDTNGKVTNIFEGEEAVTISTQAAPVVVQTGSNTTNTNNTNNTTVVAPPPPISSIPINTSGQPQVQTAGFVGIGGGGKGNTNTTNTGPVVPPTVTEVPVDNVDIPIFNVPELATNTAIDINILNVNGQPNTPSTVVENHTATKKTVGNIITTLQPVQFQKVHEWKLQGLQWELNNAKTPTEKATIKDLQQKELDLGEAYYTISQPQFNHVQGTARQEAGGLLYERANLSRETLSGTGLDTRAKERIKSIDEQLSNIESRAKRGYNSTFLEKVRNVVGPKRSVGAQRAASLPQKLIDKVDQLFNQGAERDAIIARIDDTLNELDLSSNERAEIKEIAINQLSKLDTKKYRNLGEFTKAQDAAKLDYVKGISIDKITEKSKKQIAESIKQTQLPEINQSIKDLTSYENSKDNLLGRVLSQSAVSEQLSNANSSSVKNQDWIESRVKKEANQADKKIAALKKDEKSAERNADSIKAMRDFSDIKNTVDSLVAQYINTHIEGQPQLWDNTLAEVLALDAQLTNQELDADQIKVVKKQLSAKVADLKTLYLYGLAEIENTISTNGAETNNYPPFFNPNLKDVDGGGFSLSFNNPFGNNDIYNLFPDGRGEEIFSKLTISEWSDFLNKKKILDTTTNEKTAAKRKEDLTKLAEKNFDKHKDSENTTHYDKRAERSAISKALRTVQASEVGKAVVDNTSDDFVVDIEVKKAKVNPIANAKWEILSLDTKTAYEGEILYKQVVEKDTSSKLYNDLLSEYAALVGSDQATAFAQAASQVDFEVEFAGDAAKVELIQRLMRQQLNSDVGDIVITNNAQQIEIAATEQKIADQEALVDSLDPDTSRGADARLQLHDLNELLHNQKEAMKIAGALPVVNASTFTDTGMDYLGASTIAYAHQALNGDTSHINAEVEAALDLDGLPETLTKAEVKKFIKVYNTTSLDNANILQQQAKNSVAVKIEVASLNLEQPLTGAAKAKIAAITSKNGGLENKKLGNRSDQLAAAKVIAAVNIGKIKVEGLTNPLTEIVAESQVTEKLPSNITAKYQKEIDAYNAKLDTLKEELSGLQEKLSEPTDIETTKDLELMVKANINAQQEILPFLDNVKRLATHKELIKGIDLSRKYVSPHFAITKKEKEAIKGREEQGAKEVGKVDNMIRLGRNHLKGNNKAKGLLDYHIEDLRNAVSYALTRLTETEGAFPTHQSFADSLSNALPDGDTDLSTKELRHKKAYEAYYLIGILENNELIRLLEPEGQYDPWVLEVLKPQMIADFVLGATKKMDASGAIARRVQLDKKTWSEISTTPIADWTGPIHESGLKAEGKRDLEKDPLDPKKDPNVYKILNTLKDQQWRADQEYVTIIEILTYLKNPYMNFTNKGYKRTQKAGKVIERDATITKLKVPGDKPYFANAKFGSRFRNYSAVATANQQASKLAQGGIGRAQPTEITSEGIAWLMADIAENMGWTAANMQELVNMTWDRLPELLTWSNNIPRHAHKITGDKNGKGEADAVPLALSGLLELRRVFSSPDPTTHLSHYVTYIDDSASGYQHAGALLKNRAILGATNLMPDYERQDPYVDTVSEVLKDRGIPPAKVTPEQLEIFEKIDRKFKEFEKMIELARDSKEEYFIPGEINEDGSQTPVSKVKYLYHQRRLWKESVAEELDTYYGVYWGQDYWLGKTRKAGKEGLMKGLYGAGLMGLADGLQAELSLDKGKPNEIRSDHTMWLLKHVKGAIKAKYPAIGAFEKLIKDTVEQRIGAANEAYSVWEKTRNNDDWNRFVELRDYADIAIRGISSDLPAVRRYRDPDVARVNYKSDYTKAKFNFAIGDDVTIKNKKTINKAKGASFVNLIHTTDKEIPSMIILRRNIPFVSLVHDAYGTSLNDMSKMFKEVREVRYDIFKDKDGETALYRTLKQIFPEHEAKAHEQMLLSYDGTWKPEYIFQNQHSTSKAGKVDKAKIKSKLYEAMDLTEEQINKTPATFKDGNAEVRYSDGNVSIVHSPETLKKLENMAKTSSDANTYSLLASTVENVVNKLSSFTPKVGHDVQTANIISLTDGLQDAIVNKDLDKFDMLFNELLDASESLKRKDKAFRGYVNTLIGTYASYYENLLANTKVESIPTVNSEFEGLIEGKSDVIVDKETDAKPDENQNWDRHDRPDSQIC